MNINDLEKIGEYLFGKTWKQDMPEIMGVSRQFLWLLLTEKNKITEHRQDLIMEACAEKLSQTILKICQLLGYKIPDEIKKNDLKIIGCSQKLEQEIIEMALNNLK